MPSSDEQLVTSERRARLFRNGRSQAVRIPRELEFPGTEVIIHKEGDRLIIEPAPANSHLLQVLSDLEPVTEAFPNVDDDLAPIDDVTL